MWSYRLIKIWRSRLWTGVESSEVRIYVAVILLLSWSFRWRNWLNKDRLGKSPSNKTSRNGRTASKIHSTSIEISVLENDFVLGGARLARSTFSVGHSEKILWTNASRTTKASHWTKQNRRSYWFRIKSVICLIILIFSCLQILGVEFWLSKLEKDEKEGPRVGRPAQRLALHILHKVLTFLENIIFML